MNPNIYWNFQIYISVPLRLRSPTFQNCVFSNGLFWSKRRFSKLWALKYSHWNQTSQKKPFSSLHTMLFCKKKQQNLKLKTEIFLCVIKWNPLIKKDYLWVCQLWNIRTESNLSTKTISILHNVPLCKNK